MARSSTPSKTVQELMDHPYVKRALEDPEVRENAKTAYDAATAAYERLRKEGNPAAAVFDDKRLQKELKTTAKSIASTRESLIDKPRRKRRGRLLVLAVVGAGLAIALSESLRNKVLDALFGAEEEFDYVSTTVSPATPAPTPAPAAAAAPTATNGAAHDDEAVAASAKAAAKGKAAADADDTGDEV